MSRLMQSIARVVASLVGLSFVPPWVCAAGLAGIVTLANPQRSTGQAVDASELTGLLRQAQRFRWHLRATTVSSLPMEGPIGVLRQDEFSIEGQVARVDDLMLLERRRSDTGPTTRGGLIGGGVGLAFGILVFVPFARDYGEVNELRAIATTTVVGAAFGAVIGGVTSTGRFVWQVIWRRPP